MRLRTARPVGRPTKWTPENRQALIDATEKYKFRRVAAGVAGVSQTLFQEWLTLGHKPDAPAEFAQFAEEIEQAEARFHAARIDEIKAAGKIPKLWGASAWLAERSDPAQFGRRDHVEVTGPEGAALVVNIAWKDGGPPATP